MAGHILDLIAEMLGDLEAGNVGLEADRIDMVDLDVEYVEHNLGWVAVEECLKLMVETGFGVDLMDIGMVWLTPYTQITVLVDGTENCVAVVCHSIFFFYCLFFLFGIVEQVALEVPFDFSVETQNG